MKNLILVLLALPGWVAAQTDSSMRYMEVVATEMQLTSKCESGTAMSSCCAHHGTDKGIQVEPNWCRDHSHCIHQHRHRVSEAEQAAACAEQCQHHSNYKLHTSKEAPRLLDRPNEWPRDATYPRWLNELAMPFYMTVFGQEIRHVEYHRANSINLLGLEYELVMEITGQELYDDFTAHGCSNASIYKFIHLTYQIDGLPGERVLKIQSIGVRKYFDDSLVTQIWLHEATHEISLHYVKMPVNKKDEHAEISFWANCPDGRHEMFVAGQSNNPMVRCARQYMCGLPDNGTVYTFKPVHLVLPERKHAAMQQQTFQLKVTPQTGLHQLVGLVGSDELQLFDAQGRLVKRLPVEHARQGFMLDGLAAGAYVLHDPLYRQSVRLLKP